MKKTTNSLTIQQNKRQPEESTGSRLSALVPGSLILVGFWGILVQELGIGMQWLLLLLPAVLALTAGLLMHWGTKWQARTAVGVLLLACAGCAVLFESLSAGLAGVLERIGNWWLLRTGSYIPGYETVGNIAPVLLLGALFSGFFTAWLLRMRTPLFQVLITLVFLALWMLGLLECGWWIAVYLLGTLLTLARYASGLGKALTFSGIITMILAFATAGALLLSGAVPVKTELGSQLHKTLHSLRWETAKNPMPEGALEELGVYSPTDEAALEVTMQHWTPLYLRGFVAGNYTDSGWMPLDTAQLAENADTLYALQADYFFPGEQIASAWYSLGTESENTVSIRLLGACRANTYLPYGAGNVTDHALTESQLLWEGMHQPSTEYWTAELYPVENSYLLQAELNGGVQSAYRSGESAYRDWVYQQFLTVPEPLCELFAEYLPEEGPHTTVQAKWQILQVLEQNLSYQEQILTVSGEKDFASYVLQVSREGYSVHYATLAALMLRYCGIPARYVEGYVVSPSQAEALADGETLILTQSNAHAWAEYYLDGVGWLPFDTTPGYTDIISYELPSEGTPTGNSGSQTQPDVQQDPPSPSDELPQVDQEENRQNDTENMPWLEILLWLALLIAVILPVLRTVLLRQRLRRKQKIFISEDCRKACAGILCYMQELTAAIDTPCSNPTSRELADYMTAALDGSVDAALLARLLDEVWYSGHTITPEQRGQALSWLETAKQTWKRKVPAIKRFKHRFIVCKIY